MADPTAPPHLPSAGGADRVLRRYSQCYESLKAFCAKAQPMHEETVLRWVEEMAVFAATHHPGRFVDGAIENLSLEIGSDLDRVLPTPMRGERTGGRASAPGGGKRHVLHVSPNVLHFGGHTRTLMNWIASDSESRHSLLLTRQKTPAIYAPVAEAVRRVGGELAILPGNMGLLAKARLLRSNARALAPDLIVLHHVCWDITPVVAFATPDCPPVAFVNDCDQAFWLGSSIADVVVNQRDAGARLSSQRRFITRNTVLAIPLPESSPGLSRPAARQALGIPSDQRMLLSVARGSKYRPTRSHDFFRTVRKVLDGVSDAHLYVVGLSEEQAVGWQLDWQHPQIHLCGVQDPSAYRAAADLYLESFPFGSATALLETAQAGVPVVLPFAPLSELLVTNHGLEGLVSNPGSEPEYIDRVHALLSNTAEREVLGEVLREHVHMHHTGDGWRRQLADVYRLVGECTHNPKAIPITHCGDSTVDDALSEWHAFRDGEVDSAARQLALGVAYELRECGGYREAFGALARYLRVYNVDLRILVALGKLPIHRVCRPWLQ